MRFWIKARVISPSSPQTCPNCNSFISEESNLLVRVNMPIEHEDPSKCEPGSIVIEKMRCDACVDER